MLNKNALRAKIYSEGYKIKDLTKALGMKESTFYRKMRGTSEFTRIEMENLIETLHISNPLDIFFSEEVSYRKQ